jgi:acyl-coenzyme A synthetase/AMP-(fatty) acid ligase
LGSHFKFNEVGSIQRRGDAMNISKMSVDETNIRETFLDIVTRRRSNIFLVDVITSREINYGEFHRQACALAAELRQRGVRKGDRVGVMVPNCCELAVLYFACIYLGAVIVPINPALSKTDVQFILANCKAKSIVASVSCVGAITNFEPNVLRLATARDVIKESNDSDLIRIDALSETGDFVPLETADVEDLVTIMYTSGTSAKPKGLAHKLGSMVRNANVFATAQQIDEDTRFYLTLSMAYMGGFYNLLVLPFLCGASVVVDHVFDARSSLHFWDKARNNHVNTLWLAPTVLSILLRMDRGRTGEEFCHSSVRHAFVGFAPLPLKVKHEFESRYGVRLIENYGLSETLFVAARTQDVVGGNGYVGEMLPGVALRVVNDDGKPVELDVEGEVQILTPDLMAGYLDADGTLMEMDASVWFSTGDVGHLDDSGSLFITGRKKDLIIRGGVNISPAAIEEELMHIKGVVDVAVVSIPHELYGEDIVAVLKLERGVELESMLDLVLGHAKRNLAQHQQPARYMAIDEFPRTANGKMKKARIRELVAEKLQVGSLLALRTHETRVLA